MRARARKVLSKFWADSAQNERGAMANRCLDRSHHAASQNYPPRGTRECQVMPGSRSTRTTDAEAAGNKMRTRRTPSALSDTWMPEPLHECPRSPPNPSPSQYLGARNDKQNHCVHLPAGAVADGEVHCARSTNTGSGGGERRAGLGCAAEPDVTLASALLNSPQSRTGAGMTMGMTRGARRGRRTGR